MDTQYLRPQQKVKYRELKIGKMRGTSNPSALLTKHLNGKQMTTMCGLLDVEHMVGLPSAAPQMSVDGEYVARAIGGRVTPFRSSSIRSDHDLCNGTR